MLIITYFSAVVNYLRLSFLDIEKELTASTTIKAVNSLIIQLGATVIDSLRSYYTMRELLCQLLVGFPDSPFSLFIAHNYFGAEM